MKMAATVYAFWEWELWRSDVLLDQWAYCNKIVTQGLNAWLDIMFHGATQVGTWYILIFEDDYTPTSSDTYQSPGFTECTAYDEATRPAFNEGAASNGTINNYSNPAVFSINATKTIYGAALVSDSTKGDSGAGPYMFSASNYGEGKPVENGDTLKVKLAITVTSTT